MDRDFVKPEFGIITQNYGNNTGIPFSDPDYCDYLFFVGRVRSLGLLYQLADYVLMKNNAIHNWSEWIEVFGMDKRVGYTRAQDNDRIQFMKAIRDLGNNAYGVFNQDDKIEYIGSQRQDAYKVYEQFINGINSDIAKLVWGQDVITNNTGHVIGKVGESLANMYGEVDAKEVLELVNDRLLPFLENIGLSTQGTKMQYDASEVLTQIEMADRDLKISQMGFKFDKEYIESSYSVLLNENQEQDNDSVMERYGE